MAQANPPTSQINFFALRHGMLRVFFFGLLLPLAAVSIVAALALPQIQQHSVAGQLQSVAASREAQLNIWQHTLISELGSLLVSDETLDQASAVLEGGPLREFSDDYAILTARLERVLRENRNFDVFFLVNRQGRVVLSTDLSEQSGVVTETDYYRYGLNNPYVQPPFFDPERGNTVVYAARPFYNANGEIIGVFAGRANNGRLNQIMSSPAGIGQSGETYLIDASGVLLTPNRPRQTGATINTTGAAGAVEQRSSGAAAYTNYDGQEVLGAYLWLPDLRSGVLVEQQMAEIQQQAAPAGAVFLGLALSAVLIGYVVLRALSYQYAEPVVELALTSQQIAQGDLAARPQERSALPGFQPITGEFTHMAEAVQGVVAGLQEKLQHRDSQLDQQNEFLLAYSEVSQAISSLMDPARLQESLVELLRTHFELYYVGLFLLDEDGEWAILKAATGEGGQAMLARKHRLRVGGDSMIGWAISNNLERIAHEALDDPVRLATPELPHTRSEAALPMHSRGQVIGALSVQSTLPNAFGADLINILKAMADQAAVALDNARLFEQNRQTLENLNLAYGRMSLTGWRNLLRKPQGIAYAGTAAGVEAVKPSWEQVSRLAWQENRVAHADAPDNEGLYPLAIPVRAGDIILGTITTYKPAAEGRWTAQEIDLLQTISDQLGLALESSRLYEESQRRAEYEQITGRVTASIRERLDIEMILQTAAQELRQALDLPEVTVRLAASQPQDSPTS